MYTETNCGYKIVSAETYYTHKNGSQDRVVLGHNTRKQEWVTWESVIWDDGKTDYFWGHYFLDEDDARKDYHKRLLDRLGS